MPPWKPPEGWQPPAELDRPMPRPVRLTAWGILLYVLSALILAGGLIGTVGLARECRRQQAEETRMHAQSRRVAGVVTRLWRDSEDSGDYHVDYRYAVRGRNHDATATIDSDFWNRLHPLAAVAVTYLPSEPTHNYLTADPLGYMPVWAPFLTAGIIALAGAWMPLAVRRHRRLLQRGRPAPAVVTRLRKWDTRDGTQNLVSYQFAVPGGGFCQGRSSLFRKALTAGATICILFDPANPRRNAAYPPRTVKLAAPATGQSG